jgi:hypothetical protein
METVQTSAEPLNFETVWAALMENREQLKETDRIIREVGRKQEETDRQRRESTAEFNKKLGAYINLFGDVTEAMIAPRLCEKFEEFGLYFPRANPNVRINDRVNKISFEIDIMLENGEKAILIEVKTKLTAERIDYHINRIKEMRKYADLRGDKRVFLGAVAGIVMTDSVRDYASEQGFYLIEPSGENFNITPPQGKPKEW